MRKNYRKKLRSCGLCKPHKMAKASRFTAKDLQELRAAEKEIRSAQD